VELYNFFQGALAWTASVAALWPVNVPLLALAYKIRYGADPIAMPRGEFWLRATFGALVLALLTLVMIGVDYALVEGAGFPAGPVHLTVLLAYVPAGMWVIFVFFAFDDFMQACSMFMIYICLPVLVLYGINLVVPVWQPLVEVFGDWLKNPE
jgi:hypothetical protein